MAYVYAGISTYDQTFQRRFIPWLRGVTDVSLNAGWPRAIRELAKTSGVTPSGLFEVLAREFLAVWPSPNPGGAGQGGPLGDYRVSASRLTAAVVRRPSMYYRHLSDLTAMFNGHAAAFEQLGLIKHDERFARKFSTWLKRERGANVRRGWVRGIEGRARTSGQTVDATFAECATAFLEDWRAEPPAVPMPGPAP